jgi:hypothetical protein
MAYKIAWIGAKKTMKGAITKSLEEDGESNILTSFKKK